MNEKTKKIIIFVICVIIFGIACFGAGYGISNSRIRRSGDNSIPSIDAGIESIKQREQRLREQLEGLQQDFDRELELNREQREKIEGAKSAIGKCTGYTTEIKNTSGSAIDDIEQLEIYFEQLEEQNIAFRECIDELVNILE